MLSLHHTARPDPDVVDTSLAEGDVALLHLGTKMYFSLNITAGRIWHYLKDGLTLEDVSRRLHEEFEVELDDARRNVAQLVEGLVQHNLAAIDARDTAAR
jgi:hypothetical protein